jgi:hypothetical protein
MTSAYAFNPTEGIMRIRSNRIRLNKTEQNERHLVFIDDE